jgi:hypothetical protein
MHLSQGRQTTRDMKMDKFTLFPVFKKKYISTCIPPEDVAPVVWDRQWHRRWVGMDRRLQHGPGLSLSTTGSVITLSPAKLGPYSPLDGSLVLGQHLNPQWFLQMGPFRH